MNILSKIKNHIKDNPKPLIVILGPTAAGKTAFSLKLAKEINAEIISTDSRQIYREMRISTDALAPEEQGAVPHHLIEICDPDQTLSMAEYRDRALQIIEEIYQRGHVPMLVGGTGLYISAIAEDYQLTRVPPNPKLRAKLEKEDADELHQRLKKQDPQAAENIHPNNKRYTIRALEILASGQKKSSEKAEKSPFQTLMIGIQRPREEIYQRIEKRVDEQIERGLIGEVKGLLEKYDPQLPSMSSLGVKEIIPYIKGEQSLEEASNILKQNTRHYAKRQMTWFRRYNDVLWLTPEEITEIL